MTEPRPYVIRAANWRHGFIEYAYNPGGDALTSLDELTDTVGWSAAIPAWAAGDRTLVVRDRQPNTALTSRPPLSLSNGPDGPDVVDGYQRGSACDPPPESERDDMTELNLDEIKPWLAVCGACDAGLPMACTHPQGDYRPVMARLVEEAKRLRGGTDVVDAAVAYVSAPDGSDEVGLCWWELKNAVNNYQRQVIADLSRTDKEGT